MRFLVPLGVFALLAGLLAVGLTLNPRELPSALIDKPAPAFQLPQLHQPALMFSQRDMAGQVWLFNVWASWCAACRDEHPLLVELAKNRIVPIVGLNYKDQPEAGLAWLARYGDPYVLSVVDVQGRTGIDFGVYGVPETFVIDRQGVIRYKHIGALTKKALDGKILPLVRALQAK
ncbi:MAG: DsbE family thiol:disulfide interchange protein [Burkholderiales bacterium]|nr:DsbE family thiol:disulfide interchange protein [Burkholderiales bacterium]